MLLTINTHANLLNSCVKNDGVHGGVIVDCSAFLPGSAERFSETAASNAKPKRPAGRAMPKRMAGNRLLRDGSIEHWQNVQQLPASYQPQLFPTATPNRQTAITGGHAEMLLGGSLT